MSTITRPPTNLSPLPPGETPVHTRSVPAVPKLNRMNVLLKEHEWEEGHEDEEDESSCTVCNRLLGMVMYTFHFRAGVGG